MEPDGKIDGKFPIFDNVLAFIWCKMNICPRDTLLAVVQKFYKHEDILRARDLLFTRVEQRENEPRRVKHRKVDEILCGIYTIFQGIPTEDPPVFVALDLNKIPCVDLSKIDGVAIIHEQNDTKQILNKLVEEQKVVRQNLTRLESLVSHGQSRVQPQPSRPSTTRSQPRSYSGVVRRTRNSSAGERSVNVVTSESERDARTIPSALQERDETDNAEEDSEDEQPQESHGEEGFTVVRNRNQQRRRTTITGTRTRNLLYVVQVSRKFRIFVSRLSPDTSTDHLKNYVKNSFDKNVEVIQLQTRYPTYASFVISCNYVDKDILLSPESWEEGVLIRSYRGKLPNQDD